MKLVRNFLAMKIIETLQLINFNFLVQFGDITCMNLFICSPPNKGWFLHLSTYVTDFTQFWGVF